MGEDSTTFSRTVVERRRCARCGGRYEYDRVLSVDRPAAARAAAELELDRRQAEADVAIVRCPACGKFGSDAVRARLLMLGATLGPAVLCAAAAVGLVLLAGMTGRFFWVLALAAALGAAWFALLAVVALVVPTTAKTRPASG